MMENDAAMLETDIISSFINYVEQSCQTQTWANEFITKVYEPEFITTTYEMSYSRQHLRPKKEREKPAEIPQLNHLQINYLTPRLVETKFLDDNLIHLSEARKQVNCYRQQKNKSSVFPEFDRYNTCKKEEATDDKKNVEI